MPLTPHRRVQEDFHLRALHPGPFGARNRGADMIKERNPMRSECCRERARCAEHWQQSKNPNCRTSGSSMNPTTGTRLRPESRHKSAPWSASSSPCCRAAPRRRWTPLSPSPVSHPTSRSAALPMRFELRADNLTDAAVHDGSWRASEPHSCSLPVFPLCRASALSCRGRPPPAWVSSGWFRCACCA